MVRFHVHIFVLRLPTPAGPRRLSAFRWLGRAGQAPPPSLPPSPPLPHHPEHLVEPLGSDSSPVPTVPKPTASIRCGISPRMQFETVTSSPPCKPLHWAQMQAGIDRSFHLAVNKGTDEFHQERTRHDAETGLRLAVRARRVIGAGRPPARISEDPAWWECRFRDHHAVCHGGEAVARRCRSCLHASPAAEGGLHGTRHATPRRALGASRKAPHRAQRHHSG